MKRTKKTQYNVRLYVEQLEELGILSNHEDHKDIAKTIRDSIDNTLKKNKKFIKGWRNVNS